MPKARIGSGKNAIRSANSVATAPPSRWPSRLRSDLVKIVITREPDTTRKTDKIVGTVVSPAVAHPESLRPMVPVKLRLLATVTRQFEGSVAVFPAKLRLVLGK